MCDYELPCEHPNKVEKEANFYKLGENSSWTSDGKGNHVAVATKGTLYTCPDCEEDVFVAEGTEQTYSFPCQEDEDGDGKCDGCGYVIGGHKHDWSNKDGVCGTCGEACPGHSYKPTASRDGEESYQSKDDTQHGVIVTHYTTLTCETCGHSYEDPSTEEVETRGHVWNEGACEDCGYTCQHPFKLLTFNAQKSWEEELPSVPENENTHTDHYIIHDVFDCACGLEFIPPENEGSAPGKPHGYENGKCSACGYVCQHTVTEKDGEQIRTNGKAEYFNGDVHIQHYTYEQMMKCSACLSKVDSLTGSGKDGSVAHTYTNGVCVCGAQEPAQEQPDDDDDDDDRGTTGGYNGGYTAPALPEVIEEEEEILFEEKEPAPKPAMVEKLVETVAQAEAEGSEVRIEVVGAQQVMTETEYTQLKTLSAQEQILVTLASIGFEEVVNAAVETMNDVELSADAQALMSSVSERMNQATAQEREQMEEKLAEYFPVREIEMDGKTYPYFVMELEIEVDGELTIQRYGFRMDENGEWIFVMLSEI